MGVVGGLWGWRGVLIRHPRKCHRTSAATVGQASARVLRMLETAFSHHYHIYLIIIKCLLIFLISPPVPSAASQILH